MKRYQKKGEYKTGKGKGKGNGAAWEGPSPPPPPHVIKHRHHSHPSSITTRCSSKLVLGDSPAPECSSGGKAGDRGEAGSDGITAESVLTTEAEPSSSSSVSGKISSA